MTESREKMKKSLCILAAAALMLALTACGAKEEKNDHVYTVGICQLAQHEALDLATQGFMDALNEALPGQVEFDNENASNELAACSGIVNQFVAAEVDLILANATPALQVASAATVDIPILSTSVTEYGVAMGIENFDGVVGGNVSGTSDLAPLDEQAAMILEWFPEAKNIGLLYCSSEANSRYQVDGIKAELEALGCICTEYPFTDSNDLSGVTESAASACDVIYVPTDNTIASNAAIIDNVCSVAGMPVMGGDSGICASCGVAALSISYYDLGAVTGKMAARILTGEAEISQIPVEYAEAQKVYNAAACERLGLTAPQGYTALK